MKKDARELGEDNAHVLKNEEQNHAKISEKNLEHSKNEMMNAYTVLFAKSFESSPCFLPHIACLQKKEMESYVLI